MSANTTKISLWAKYRTLILVLAVMAFLPPLALIFQASTGSVNFCGEWCPRMFFTWREGMTTTQFFMGFLRSYMGVALVAAILLSTLFFGRYWCSHLCPVGSSTELGSRLVPKKLRINYTGISAPPVRYGYLAVYLLAPLFGIGSLCCSYCNFATMPRLFGAAFMEADLAYFLRTAGLINLGMIFLLGFMARGGRGYCNFFCPIGALDSLVNRIGARFGKRMRVSPDKCNGCGACEKVCPTWAIDRDQQQATINHYSCFPCRECQKACPQQAIDYR